MELSNPELLELPGAWQNEVESLEPDPGHLERNHAETLLKQKHPR